MAIAVGHCHDLKPPPAARGRYYRPHSVAQLDHQETNPNDGGGSLSPQRRSLSSPCFTTVAAPAAADDHAADNDDKAKMLPRVEVVAGRHAPGVHELIAEAAGAMASGTRLVPAQGGLGGALLLNDGRSGEHVAVIKPLEDASNNDGGGPGGGYESKSVLREVAAFLLDHDGFASVAPTALIKISRPAMETQTTMASIQRFVAHSHDAGELGPSRFSVTSVHRVGILDVRLLNIDRHAGNILVKDTSGATYWAEPLELVPIDHGLCLPEQLEDPYFEWLHWPQSSMPFSAEELDYIASLDALSDAEMLRAEMPSLTEPAIRILTLCTVFLQRAAAAGFCLAEIGDMMTREFSSAEEGMSVSELEALCNKAVDGNRKTDESPRHVSFGELSGEEWAAFLEKFEQLLPPAFEAKMKKL